ncbi:MAG: hypothetical protein HOH92_04580 [Crocinitomicaceae bacterium]|nr:hypothetical protein [Crocinitomicaceae bacterium]
MQWKFILRNPRLRVAFALVSAMVVGCQVPAENPNGSCDLAFKYLSPEVAQGFRWKKLSDPEGREVLSCLEVFNVAFEEVATTIYRDSVAFHSDPCPKGERVVLNAASRGIATLSTTHVALLEAWDDSLDHWAGGAFVDYIQSGQAKVCLMKGEAVDYRGTPEWDLEMLVSHPPSALCIYPFGNPINDATWSATIPIVPILEYLEPHPLGRAEWMKVFGWLVDDVSLLQANLAFDEVARRYESIRLAAKRQEPLQVFTGSVEQGEWHAPGGESFIASLLEDAGLSYVFQDRLGRENVRIPLEEMIEIGRKADAWGLVLHHSGSELTISELLQKDDRNRLVLPDSRRVFVANTSQCDYFGWWVARPDVMLENLTCLFEGSSCSMDMEPCFKWLAE